MPVRSLICLSVQFRRALRARSRPPSEGGAVLAIRYEAPLAAVGSDSPVRLLQYATRSPRRGASLADFRSGASQGLGQRGQPFPTQSWPEQVDIFQSGRNISLRQAP